MDVKTIEERQKAEKEFHDKKFAEVRKVDYNELGFKRLIFSDMIEKIGDIRGKKVLEFGCGEGWFTKILARKGAEVWSFDISEEAVKKAESLMIRESLNDRVHLEQMAAENLRYDSDMFDLVVGIAILHHLDTASLIREIKRVLIPGGRAIFMEPLGHNPLLNFYRRMTPNVRSKDETPMRFEQFASIEQAFARFEHKEYYLTTIFALIFYFVGMNKLMLKTRDKLHRLDKEILDTFPTLSRYCWYSLLSFEK
jgi:2-polyprenyl-3-methyl-5-hydroxy-6-metoxy-1,4-benzoquinol methylase